MSGGSSYNGWPANDDPNAIGIDRNFGASVGTPGFGSGGYVGGMKSGDVATVFAYLIGRLDAEIEPMMTGDGGDGYGCWGYSYRANVNNPSTLSCHASGTAIDYNAPAHPNGTSTGPSGGGGWSGDQYHAIMAILNGPLQGCIEWLTGNDPMHFEISGNAAQVAAVAASIGGSTPPPEPEEPFTMGQYEDIMGKLNAIQEVVLDIQAPGTRTDTANQTADALSGVAGSGKDVEFWNSSQATNAFDRSFDRAIAEGKLPKP